MDNETIEKLASIEHVQWERWARTVCGDLEVLLNVINEHVSLDDLNQDEMEVIEKNAKRVETWPKFMIDYELLSDEIKEKDRVYARRVYEICKSEFE